MNVSTCFFFQENLLTQVRDVFQTILQFREATVRLDPYTFNCLL